MEDGETFFFFFDALAIIILFYFTNITFIKAVKLTVSIICWYNRRMITFLRARRARIFWAVLVLIALLFGLNAWYKSVYSDPRRVFDAMIENSLRTSSVTKRVIQNSEDQTLDQSVRLTLGKDHIAQGMTQLSQSGLASATVTTESLGTPLADFVRYKSIDTDQKNDTGQDLDFSCILGVWGKSGSDTNTAGELYNELVLGVVPIGNLSASNRKELLQKLNELDVYKVEYENVERGSINGRPAYEYTVKVLPEAYVEVLITYARMVGLTHLQNIQPETYANAEPIEFKVSVDVMTRRLAGITYDSGRQEYYSAYGSQVAVDVPSDTVTVEELQSRLQAVGSSQAEPRCP